MSCCCCPDMILKMPPSDTFGCRSSSSSSGGVRGLIVLALESAAARLLCPQARKMLGWPKRSKLTHAFLWDTAVKG